MEISSPNFANPDVYVEHGNSLNFPFLVNNFYLGHDASQFVSTFQPLSCDTPQIIPSRLRAAYGYRVF